MKKCKWYKSKYFYIAFAFIVGLLLTILFSKNIYDCDILFAIGSGIFGSSFVALLLEILSDIRQKQKIKEQREFVFEDIKYKITNLLRTELFNYSQYCNLYLKKTKIENKEEEINKIFKQLNDYETKIYEYILKDISQTHIVPDKLWLENYNKKCNFLYKNTLPHYELLLKDIIKIVNNKDFYKSLNIINDDEYDNIDSMFNTIQYIISNSQTDNEDNIIDDKHLFFEEIEKFYKSFNNNKDEKIKIRYYIEG